MLHRRVGEQRVGDEPSGDEAGESGADDDGGPVVADCAGGSGSGGGGGEDPEDRRHGVENVHAVASPFSGAFPGEDPERDEGPPEQARSGYGPPLAVGDREQDEDQDRCGVREELLAGVDSHAGTARHVDDEPTSGDRQEDCLQGEGGPGRAAQPGDQRCEGQQAEDDYLRPAGDDGRHVGGEDGAGEQVQGVTGGLGAGGDEQGTESGGEGCGGDGRRESQPDCQGDDVQCLVPARVSAAVVEVQQQSEQFLAAGGAVRGWQ
ncbi:hypothetical protein [Plantactinospora sp. DSM 117369]